MNQHSTFRHYERKRREAVLKLLGIMDEMGLPNGMILDVARDIVDIQMVAASGFLHKDLQHPKSLGWRNIVALSFRSHKKPCPECGELLNFSGLKMHYKTIHPEKWRDKRYQRKEK